MQTVTSLSFKWQCKEAFTFYATALDAKNDGFMPYSQMPADPNMPLAPEYAEWIMHTALSKDGKIILMWADVLTEMNPNFILGNNIEVCIMPDSRAEADRMLAALSEGWQVIMPMKDEFWGDYFGACKDKFGIGWMINYSEM